MNEQKTKTVQALDSVITSIYNIVEHSGDRWERAGKLLEVVWTELKRDAEVEGEEGEEGEEGGDKQGLINDVIEQIKEDVESQDMTAIEELLRFVPTEYLLGYLSEEAK